jgi:hypothetical protein
MNLLKKMMQTGVLASLLYSGISAKAKALLKDADIRYAAKMRLLAKEAGVKLEKVLK